METTKTTQKSTRRPTLTRRVASLVVGTALAGGLAVASASPAHAASSVWDQVAACESSGNWSINTGNGYYGGLQFSESTWLAYGGGSYAQYANQATKAQQIAVAQKVLASQGAEAWPVCSVKAGLTTANGGASSSSDADTSSTSSSSTSSTTTSSSSGSASSTSGSTSSSSTSSKPTTAPRPPKGHAPKPKGPAPKDTHAPALPAPKGPAPKGPAPRPGHPAPHMR